MGIPSVSKQNMSAVGGRKSRVDKSTSAGFRSIFVSSSTHIWRSKVSWRIALTAFMTILLVQTLVLNMGGIERYRQEQLISISDQARLALAAIIDPKQTISTQPPFSNDQVDRLLQTNVITGLSVYSYKFDYVKSYGSPPELNAEVGGLDRRFMSPDGKIYETIFRTQDLQSRYLIVAQIDTSTLDPMVFQYVKNSIMIMVTLSLFVTFVLMVALGKWLIEPMLFMRANLVSAFKNPEAPDIQDSPYNASDEIGAAIELTQKLIEQNAENLNNLKSTAEDKIHKLAYYDTLTSLPNRALFVQTLDDHARDAGNGLVKRFAIVALDLDHFKDINDSMGHNVGDAILRSVGKKLRASLPETAVVSRVGEDEFAIMMPLATDTLNAKDVGERVMGVIRAEPFKVFNEEFQVRASVGVSTFPDDGAEPDVVLKNADIALNRAKEEGRDTIKEYSEDFDRAVQERFQILRNLRDALEQDQLQLHFQPQLCLKTGKVIGAEALLRWWKPDNSKNGGQFISPGIFIPVAEQSGLIVPIGKWVLNKACEVAKVLHSEHDMDIRFAINVSGNQFVNSDICEDLQEALDRTGVDPKLLELEVTESVFMDDINNTVNILKQLHGMGVEIAIDDFGTGYSSLSYLSQFPIDRLKIDQSFVRNALNQKENASIARTIINLGHSLDLKVIAEGVETKEHEDFLIQEGCDEVQGFRYSKPVPADDLVEFVKSYNGDLKTFS